MTTKQDKVQVAPIEQPEITIDPELKKLLPELTPEELRRLEQDIKDNGCRDDLVVGKFTEGGEVKEYLIDGHHRYKICRKHKKLYGIKLIEFDNREKVMEWMVMNQRNRRNMSKFRWAEFALRFRKTYSDAAKKNQEAGVRLKSNEGINTLVKLSKIAGLSHDTISKVSYILKNKNASKEEIDKLRMGHTEISINGVYQKYKDEEKKNKTQTDTKADDKPKASRDIGKNRPSKKAYRKKFSTILTSLEKHEESITEEERVEFWEGLLLVWLLDDSRLGTDKRVGKLRAILMDTDDKESD